MHTARRRWPLRSLHAGRWLVAALVVLIALVLVRRPVSEWIWPDTRAQQLRADAALALAQGRLTSVDGRGARELYEAALALDPDRADAQQGLMRVGQAAIAQARDALRERRYADAHRALALARELAMPRAVVDPVADALREQEAAAASVDRLLEQADAARAAGRLDGGSDSALALYQRVLALEPGHVHALEGREDTLADLIQKARGLLRGGKLASAAAVLQSVQAADAGHADLPAAAEHLTRQLDERRRTAARDLRRGRPEQAWAHYRLVLDVQPGDPEAERGVLAVADALAARSQRMAADFRFAEAEAALRQARSIAPDSAAVASAQEHLARARQSQRRVQGEAMTPARQKRLAALLQQMAVAEARGDLLLPVGDSAFDRLRAAQEIAPRDARVRRAAARLAPAARHCFDRELQGNRVLRARECLDAWQALEGRSPGVTTARRRLAQRWVAVGTERLGAGELRAAQSAIAAARDLDGTTPGLEELARRLRAASAASR